MGFNSGFKGLRCQFRTSNLKVWADD